MRAPILCLNPPQRVQPPSSSSPPISASHPACRAASGGLDAAAAAAAVAAHVQARAAAAAAPATAAAAAPAPAVSASAYAHPYAYGYGGGGYTHVAPHTGYMAGQGYSAVGRARQGAQVHLWHAMWLLAGCRQRALLHGAGCGPPWRRAPHAAAQSQASKAAPLTCSLPYARSTKLHMPTLTRPGHTRTRQQAATAPGRQGPSLPNRMRRQQQAATSLHRRGSRRRLRLVETWKSPRRRALRRPPPFPSHAPHRLQTVRGSSSRCHARCRPCLRSCSGAGVGSCPGWTTRRQTRRSG